MDQLPSPLTPPGCDLRDFAYMPLDVARLRDSDLASTELPEACWAAVLLWAASWHQVPAASLPDDDRVLSNLSGYGRVVKEWMRVKDGAMRGWVKCSDGRLYHPVVAEKARESWASKISHAYGKMAERLRKLNKQRAENKLPAIPQPTIEEWLSAGKVDPVPPENIKSSAGIPPENKNLPAEQISDSAGKQESSAGIPPENALKGEVREKDIEIPSEAKASGGKPPLTPDEIIFGYGVPILTNAGTAEKQARSFLGGLRKAHGDDALVNTLRECIRAKPLQPLEWLAKAMPPAGSAATKTPNKQEALEARNRAVADAWATEMEAKMGVNCEAV